MSKIVWAEMARRKVRFHSNKNWNEIRLWGLFKWSLVSKLIKTGELLTNMHKENGIVWVTPSKEAWEKNIKPLIDNYTLDELTTMAGWDI